MKFFFLVCLFSIVTTCYPGIFNNSADQAQKTTAVNALAWALEAVQSYSQSQIQENLSRYFDNKLSVTVDEINNKVGKKIEGIESRFETVNKEINRKEKIKKNKLKKQIEETVSSVENRLKKVEQVVTRREEERRKGVQLISKDQNIKTMVEYLENKLSLTTEKIQNFIDKKIRILESKIGNIKNLKSKKVSSKRRNLDNQIQKEVRDQLSNLKEGRLRKLLQRVKRGEKRRRLKRLLAVLSKYEEDDETLLDD